MTGRAVLHLGLHAALPALAAWGIARTDWRRVWLWLMAGWVIDVDHLLASPVYDPDRCSLGFHPLHTWPAAVGYAVLLLPRRTRLLALGLLLHLTLDGVDCLVIRG